MFIILLASTLAGTPPCDDPAPRPLPTAAHNCYPSRGHGRERIEEALRLGIDNIEIDLGWDSLKKRLIVTHEADPKGNPNAPEFESYLLPALRSHWKNIRDDKAPTILTIDWKTARPEAISRFKDFLDSRPDWFSSAPKTADGALTTRRLTVCLTGSEEAKDRYDALIPEGGIYRAFKDRVFGGDGSYLDDVHEYAPKRATTYHRFVTIAWGHVERGGPALSRDWTKDEQSRLCSIVKRVHEQGFRVRFYCLNCRGAGPLDPYAFPSSSAARLRWLAARRAGTDWIASDNYQELVEALKALKDTSHDDPPQNKDRATEEDKLRSDRRDSFLPFHTLERLGNGESKIVSRGSSRGVREFNRAERDESRGIG